MSPPRSRHGPRRDIIHAGGSRRPQRHPGLHVHCLARQVRCAPHSSPEPPLISTYRLTIPLLDSHRRIIALLGGTPRDGVGWKAATNGAATLLQERLSRIHLSDEQLHHRHAQESFPAIARGVSYGGGWTEPGEMCNNISNTQLTDELLAHRYFQRITTFTTILFATWAPLLFAFYQVQMALLRKWKLSLRWNFAGSIFAACTFNFGPCTITAPHLDFANLSWGWCTITTLGNFDPDRGGHLILWDLRLVIRFPPGSTILLPSALVRHSNVPIQAHEHRCSFMQYTAGGLFRWVRNSFKTDKAWESSASMEDQATRKEEKKLGVDGGNAHRPTNPISRTRRRQV
ncbi:hypothetical protein DFH09DRAFT_901023 [Mycena vulgaris]|nr:hypothetical protein DFH09DRAFT_901023 [Mycena vulgaris]